MQCPMCNSYQVVCVDSRPIQFRVHRRRKCNDCGRIFHTIEFAMNDMGIMPCEACPWLEEKLKGNTKNENGSKA